MRERTWLETTSWGKSSSVEGPRKNGTRAKTITAAAAMGAAILSHHLGSTQARPSALAALRSDNCLKICRSFKVERAGFYSIPQQLMAFVILCAEHAVLNVVLNL